MITPEAAQELLNMTNEEWNGFINYVILFDAECFAYCSLRRRLFCVVVVDAAAESGMVVVVADAAAQSHELGAY